MNSLEVAKRIEKIATRKGINGAELARMVGIDRSTINRYFKGIRKLPMDDIPKFAQVLDVNVVELLLGEEGRPTNLIELKPEFVKVPILGPIACGTPILVEENFEGYTYELKEYLPHGNIFALIARGDSMEPTIQDGCKVLVREQKDVENGEIAAVLVNGNTEATLKRVKKQGDNIFLLPDNPKHEMYIVTEANPATIIGKAVRVIRDLL